MKAVENKILRTISELKKQQRTIVSYHKNPLPHTFKMIMATA
jgi:hypothetical protein